MSLLDGCNNDAQRCLVAPDVLVAVVLESFVQLGLDTPFAYLGRLNLLLHGRRLSSTVVFYFHS